MSHEMQKIDNDHYVWVEKYRPQTVHDLIIPDEIRQSLLKWVEQDKQIPNIGIFGNTPGLGKTSLAKAIINDLRADSKFINSSKENGIDLVRTTIQGFASSRSMEFEDDIDELGPKVIILDEFDGTTQDMQKSFRSSIEDFSKNCRFILTGNYTDRIMEPILNRLMNFNLDNLFAKHKQELAKQIYERLCYILENEKISYEPQDIKTLIGNFYPSVREMIQVMQQSSLSGKLIVDYTHAELNKQYNQLIECVKTKDYDKCRLLASEINTPNGFYKFVYRNLSTLFEPASMPQVVVITQHFMSTNTNARDPEISVAAFCARLMLSVDIKFLKN